MPQKQDTRRRFILTAWGKRYRQLSKIISLADFASYMWAWQRFFLPRLTCVVSFYCLKLPPNFSIPVTRPRVTTAIDVRREWLFYEVRTVRQRDVLW